MKVNSFLMNTKPLQEPNTSPIQLSSWRRKLGIAFFILAGIFGVLVFLMTMTNFPTYAVRKVIDYRLLGSGVHLTRLDHVTFGQNFMTLEEPEIMITQDAHRILATRIDIAFNAWGLLRGDLKSIHIQRPHLHINPTPEFPDFHVIRKVLYQVFQEISGLDSFEIKDGLFHFGLYSPLGFDGNFFHKSQEDAARLEIEFIPSVIPFPDPAKDSVSAQSMTPSQATLILTENKGQMLLRVDSPHFKFVSDQSMIELRNLKLKIQDPSALPRDLPIDIPFDMSMSAALMDLKSSVLGQLKKPLTIKMKAGPIANKVEASLKISGEINKQLIPLLTAEAIWNPSLDEWPKNSTIPASESLAPSHKDTVRGTIKSLPINVTEWFDVSPILSKIYSSLVLNSAILTIDGGFRGEFVPLNFETDSIFSGILPHLNIALKNVNVSSDLFHVTDMSTHLSLDSLMPISSKMNQSLTVKEIALKNTILKDGKILYSLSPDGFLTLNSVTFGAFDGRVQGRDFKYLARGDLSQGMAFKAVFQGLNLAPLINMADMDSFKAEGSLSGEGHFSIGPQGLEIYSVSMKNDKPGLLNYKAPPAAVQGDAKIYLDALAGFKYNTLKVDVQGVQDRQNDLNAQIYIKGNNPNLLNGYPFEFNINTTGQLHDVIRSALSSFVEPKNMDDIRKIINKE